MTCKACGRDVPLEDKNCFECNGEGPFTRADRLTPWKRRFAWLPVRIEDHAKAARMRRYPSYSLVWLRWVEERVLSVFGYNDYQARLASVGRNAERQDAEERLGPKDEHAVPSEETADAQTPSSEHPNED